MRGREKGQRHIVGRVHEVAADLPHAAAVFNLEHANAVRFDVQLFQSRRNSRRDGQVYGILGLGAIQRDPARAALDAAQTRSEAPLGLAVGLMLRERMTGRPLPAEAEALGRFATLPSGPLAHRVRAGDF